MSENKHIGGRIKGLFISKIGGCDLYIISTSIYLLQALTFSQIPLQRCEKTYLLVGSKNRRFDVLSCFFRPAPRLSDGTLAHRLKFLLHQNGLHLTSGMGLQRYDIKADVQGKRQIFLVRGKYARKNICTWQREKEMYWPGWQSCEMSRICLF